jgi:hypothetical protein
MAALAATAAMVMEAKTAMAVTPARAVAELTTVVIVMAALVVATAMTALAATAALAIEAKAAMAVMPARAVAELTTVVMAALAVATAMAAMASMASMAAMAAAAASPLFPIRLFPVLFPLLKLTRFIDYYPRSSRNKEKGWVRSSLVRKNRK